MAYAIPLAFGFPTVYCGGAHIIRWHCMQNTTFRAQSLGT